jgi:cell division protein ZapB
VESVLGLGGRLGGANAGQLVVDDLHADPDVLDQFGVGLFFGVRVVGAVGVDPGKFGDVLDEFLDLFAQRRRRDRAGGPEAVQESLAPLAKRGDAFLDRDLVVGQQRGELEFDAGEIGAAALMEIGQRARVDIDGIFVVRIGENFLEPFGRKVDAAGAERAAETTVRLGRAHCRAPRRERPLDVFERNWACHHAYRTTAALAELIPTGGGPIVTRMTEPAARTAVDAELRRIEKRIDELVATVSQLKEENRALRQRQETLISERANLLQKNEQVRARVEAMIGRLKSMEQG